MTDKEYFKGKCPYTDKPCDHFKCDTCEVEANERKWINDLYGYDSPITMIAGEVTTSLEDGCLKVVQSYGFNVDKEQLTKALAYDRDQYDKGYADAKRKYERPTGKWIRGYDGCSHYLFCSECNHSRQIEYYYGEIVYPKFCEDCGADMRKGGASDE